MDESSTATVPRFPGPYARGRPAQHPFLSEGKRFLLVENSEFQPTWACDARAQRAAQKHPCAPCSCRVQRQLVDRACVAFSRPRAGRAPTTRGKGTAPIEAAFPPPDPRTPTPPRPRDHAQEEEGEGRAGARARESTECPTVTHDAALRVGSRIPSVNTAPSWCGPRRLGGRRGATRRATARQRTEEQRTEHERCCCCLAERRATVEEKEVHGGGG